MIIDAAPQIFDRALLHHRRVRAAASFGQVHFLKEEAAERVAERLTDLRKGFPLSVDLGCHDGTLARVLQTHPRIETLISADFAEPMSRRAPGCRLVCDEEMLPFAENSLDAVFSVLDLHWVNDLPGCLIQIRRALKPDGMLLAILPGANTLKELRQALLRADMEISGGAAPRIAPFPDIRDAGALLQRAGFTQPILDSETLTVTYENALMLLQDIKSGGETNTLHQRSRCFTTRRWLMRVTEAYRELYGDTEGRIPATAELLSLMAWKPKA